MKSGYSLLIASTVAALLSTPAALSNDTDTARNLVNKGNFQMASGHFNEALKTYEDALKYEPRNAVIKDNIAKVYNNWACSLTKQHKYYEAQEKLQKCLELAPGYGQARNNMALLRRHAEDEGIDLSLPPDQQGESNSDVPIPPDMPGRPKTPKEPVAQAGSQAPKVAPVAPPEQQAGAVLFIGGVKQPLTNTPSPNGSDFPNVDSYPVSATSGPGAPNSSGPVMVSPVVSQEPLITPNSVPSSIPMSSPIAAPSTVPSGVPNSFTAKPMNPMFPVTPNQFPALPKSASTSSTAPVVPSVFAPTAQSVQVSPTVSLDQQLSSVEMKVYGQKQGDLTVLQRLEKIERDAAGQVRTGTIVDRIEYLKKSFGL